MRNRVRSTAVLAGVLLAGADLAHAQTPVYVANRTANVVTAIDTATGSVAATVPVGVSPIRIAVNRDGTRAYVANSGSSSISVIDTATNSVLATITTAATPSALAVTPDGRRVYVMVAGGVVQAIDTSRNAVTASITVGGSGGDIAVTPDGTRAYVASGLVSVIDTATNAIAASFSATSAGVNSIAMAPDGLRAYLTTNGADIFGSEGGVVVLDTTTNAVIRTITLGVLPGQIAIAPDGSRIYVGVAHVWVNTGYGAAFIPGASVAVIDTLTFAEIAWMSLGSGGAAWTLQNTAAGIAVTPDKRDIYVAIPRINSVAIAGTNTNLVRQLIPVAAGPQGVAAVPDPSGEITPYVIDAVDDIPEFSLPSTGGTAVANVLANDRLGGAPVTLGHVSISQVVSTDPSIALDPATAAVNVAAGAPLGSHTLVYRICEIAAPLSCDEASVFVVVRNRYVINAVNDSATARPGTVALISVLTNDTLGGGPATTSSVSATPVSSTHPGLVLDPTYASISVAPGTTLGPHTLVYRICEKADPLNCDEATASIQVVGTPLDAVNDIGVSTRSGGVATFNVLANDTLAGTPASLTRVTLEQVSSTHGGVRLAITSAAVTVLAGTPIGTYSLVYRICERANLSNCDQATVTVTVNPYEIRAVNDSAKASSKVANTAVASVLANDFLGSVRATTANVKLSFVSLKPANRKIKLDLVDGSVDVLGRTNSGLYLLVYQICEIELPTNCARATVTLDLSGGF